MAKLKYSPAVMIGSNPSSRKLDASLSTAGSTHRYAIIAPAAKSPKPAITAGMILRFSSSYRAGDRKVHACQRITGNAKIAPTRTASLIVMRKGSSGCVKKRLPSARYGAIGSFRRPNTSRFCTIKNPATEPTARAARLHRIRHRSSSRWSRNGI